MVPGASLSPPYLQHLEPGAEPNWKTRSGGKLKLLKCQRFLLYVTYMSIKVAVCEAAQKVGHGRLFQRNCNYSLAPFPPPSPQTHTERHWRHFELAEPPSAVQLLNRVTWTCGGVRDKPRPVAAQVRGHTEASGELSVTF